MTTRLTRLSLRLAAAALALLIGLLSTVAAKAALTPCRDADFARPAGNRHDTSLTATPRNGLGCLQGVFVAAGEGTRLWRCAVRFPEGQEIPEDAPEHGFLLERRGHDLIELPDTLMAGRLRSFDLISIDLDGDGVRERVLAAWNSQGNGIGVNSWTIRIFSSDWTLLRRFDEVLDWGDHNLVAAPRGRRGCDIAVTDFVQSWNRQGREGVSFKARFFALTNAGLVPAADRPTLQRRYDRSFERQRSALFERSEERSASEVKGDLTRWLNHPSANAVKTH